MTNNQKEFINDLLLDFNDGALTSNDVQGIIEAYAITNNLNDTILLNYFYELKEDTKKC